jgi:hypothetical protein
MAILMWLLGGTFLSNLAVGLIAVAISSSGAYIKGRMDCANAAEVAALHAQVAHYKKQIEIREWLDSVGNDLSKESADADTHNTQVDEAIKDAITNAPTVDGCATADFLDRLRYR